MTIFEDKKSSEVNTDLLRPNRMIRIHDVYYEKNEKYGNVIKLKRGGNIFAVPFSVPGIDHALQIELVMVDSIGEFIANPKNAEYLTNLGILHIEGQVHLEDEGNSIYLHGKTWKILIKVRDESLKQFLCDMCKGKQVLIKFARIYYGRDAIEAAVTVFTKIDLKSSDGVTVAVPKMLTRYEFPAQVMSLREMIDSGAVGTSSVAVTYIEDRKTKEEKDFLQVFLYDSTAIVKLNVFQPKEIELFKKLPYHRILRLEGIFTVNRPSGDLKTIPSVKIRPIERIRMKKELMDPTFTDLNMLIDLPVVTQGLLLRKDDIRAFMKRDGTAGHKITFYIEQKGVEYKITSYNKKDCMLVDNISVNDHIEVWWVKMWKGRYIVENFGYVTVAY